MKKVVINQCYGGFGLSHEAVLRYCEIKRIKVWPEFDSPNSRLIGATYFSALSLARCTRLFATPIGMR